MSPDSRDPKRTSPGGGLVFDWNGGEDSAAPQVSLLDETLRDGLQSPSVRYPGIEQKIVALERMSAAGIEFANLGLPSTSARAFEDVLEMCRAIARLKLAIRPVCAGRTVAGDVAAIVEVSERAEIAVEASLFIGSSALRTTAEGWDLPLLLRRTENAIDQARAAGLAVTFVSEDTTRSQPDTLRALFSKAIERGATRICLCDTVGFATPPGVTALVRFAREVVGQDVGIDWHGHDDRGLALANALIARRAGADRLHATALGIGERVGNTAMELLLLNLWLAGAERPLAPVAAYCAHFADVLGVPIPDHHPLVGRNAFRTATGVHAAAIVKAQGKDAWLADHVYGLLSPSQIGAALAIDVGQMSGSSNVQHWLRRHGFEPSEPLLKALLERAKGAERVLTDEELLSVVERVRGSL
ncbi:MAG TPA: LeuA family protein [Polyangiaceae bacterium]